MRSLVLSAALLLAVTDAVEAARFPRAVQGSGYLKVPVGTVERSKKTKRDDANSVVTTLENLDFFYATEIEFGFPPQSVTVLVDTGSSELWVNPDCDTAPSQYQAYQCQQFGHYDPNKSNTPPVGPFGRNRINYGDVSDPSTHSSVDIRYYIDTLRLGDAEIQNQTFGVVSSSKGQSQGIFGLAPDLEKGFDGDAPYSLMLHSMAEQGVIDTRLFSLDLRHAEAKTGSIVYGGVDRSKFIGDLETKSIIRGTQGEYRLAVAMDTMGLTLDGEARDFELHNEDRNVMLDSGTTISRIHFSAARPILEALGAIDDGEGYFYTSCDVRESGGSVDFGFGNKTVRVPFRDFLLNDGGSNSYYCTIGMVITQEQQVLGDSVLRAGYFVFDWDNEEVHIAQAADCGDEDIVAVGTGKDALSGVKGKCSEDDALFTGGPIPTATRSGSLPTGVYTTTYTITSCPLFIDSGCQTGVVTTQTISGTAMATQTDSSGDGGKKSDSGNGDGNGDGDEDGAASGQIFSLALLTMGMLTSGMFCI